MPMWGKETDREACPLVLPEISRGPQPSNIRGGNQRLRFNTLVESGVKGSREVTNWYWRSKAILVSERAAEEERSRNRDLEPFNI